MVSSNEQYWPERLYEMVDHCHENCPEILIWNQGDTGFKIFDEEALRRDIFPRFGFISSKTKDKHQPIQFPSFIKQLSEYGFKTESVSEKERTFRIVYNRKVHFAQDAQENLRHIIKRKALKSCSNGDSGKEKSSSNGNNVILERIAGVSDSIAGLEKRVVDGINTVLKQHQVHENQMLRYSDECKNHARDGAGRLSDFDDTTNIEKTSNENLVYEVSNGNLLYGAKVAYATEDNQASERNGDDVKLSNLEEGVDAPICDEQKDDFLDGFEDDLEGFDFPEDSYSASSFSGGGDEAKIDRKRGATEDETFPSVESSRQAAAALAEQGDEAKHDRKRGSTSEGKCLSC